MFNPTVEKFLKENKDVTVIGLFWAGYWRLYLIIFGAIMFFAVLTELFE